MGAYAKGLKAQIQKERVTHQLYQEARQACYLRQLMNSTQRLQEESVARPIAKYLTRWELQMKSGNERDHLQELFKSASMRGTDIRFFTLIDEETVQHEVPYPALRWKWQIVTSTHGSRHRGRSVKKFHTRWLHILDSMVSRGALAKGRSSSTRLNKVLKKHAAAALAQDGYLFPLWTISQWNFSDKASRRHA